MKSYRTIVTAVLMLVGFVGITVAQNPDPAANIFPQGSVVAGIGVNSARTGTAVDRQGYHGAMIMVAQGHVTNGAGAIVYWVVQDSVIGGTWAAADSVLADTVDNKAFKFTYKGVKRFLRVIQRATSASTDTTISGGLVVLTTKRSR